MMPAVKRVVSLGESGSDAIAQFCSRGNREGRDDDLPNRDSFLGDKPED